jgi:hypothetical protein
MNALVCGHCAKCSGFNARARSQRRVPSATGSRPQDVTLHSSRFRFTPENP